MQKDNTTNQNTEGVPSFSSKITWTIEGSIALIGNSVVIFLFTRRPQWFSKPHNLCILNLAITDILTALVILINRGTVMEPSFAKDVSSQIFLRELYCRLVWSHYILFSLPIISLYICVVLSLERWLAVRKPIVYSNLFKTWHMKTLIILSWIVGFAFGIPQPLFFKGVYDKQLMICSSKEGGRVIIATVMFFGAAIIPFAVIFAAYIDVFRSIRASIKFAVSARNDNVNSLKRLKKVTNMTAITSFLLFICWVPAKVNLILTALGYITVREDGNGIRDIIFKFLIFLNPCLNPFVYVFSNPEFRKAFKEVFCPCFFLRRTTTASNQDHNK